MSIFSSMLIKFWYGKTAGHTPGRRTLRLVNETVFFKFSLIALHVQNVFTVIVERIQYGYRKWGSHACTSVLKNTCAWEQQDLNKTMKHRKKVRRGK